METQKTRVLFSTKELNPGQWTYTMHFTYHHKKTTIRFTVMRVEWNPND